jgi:hypothetical protein
MSALFPPYNAAVDFFGSCAKWTPVPGNLDKSIWNFYDALPLITESIALINNGFGQVIGNANRDLRGGLDPSMVAAMMEVYTPLAAAAVKATELLPTFVRIYADALARRSTVGGSAVNV